MGGAGLESVKKAVNTMQINKCYDKMSFLTGVWRMRRKKGGERGKKTVVSLQISNNAQNNKWI